MSAEIIVDGLKVDSQQPYEIEFERPLPKGSVIYACMQRHVVEIDNVNAGMVYIQNSTVPINWPLGDDSVKVVSIPSDTGDVYVDDLKMPSALDVQVGGNHYKTCKIQPVEYIEANELQFLEGNVLKRITRHNKPTGKGRQDIEKAIHELQLLLELRYRAPA